MTKHIEFCFNTKTEQEMHEYIKRLQDICKDNNLELSEGRFINSFIGLKDHETGKIDGYRYYLDIKKRAGITYNQIYGLINSIQACYYKVSG